MIGPAKYLPRAYYALTFVVLAAYGLRTHPFTELGSFGLYLLMLAAPLAAVGWIRGRLERQVVDCQRGLLQARRQFALDFVLYLLAAAGIVAGVALWDPVAPTHAGKLVVGTLIIGYFASIDLALSRERHCYLGNSEALDAHFKPGSVARRLGVFLTVTTLISLSVITMAGYDYLGRLAADAAPPVADLRQGFAVDAIFVFVTVVGLTLRLIYSYSRNLHFNFTTQIEALRDVQSGKLGTRVPVMGRDEFAVIAQQINKMIEGLREKEQVAKTLERIVSPSIMQKLLTMDTDSLQVGQEYEVAVLFCDLRDFTSFAEYSPPEDVIYFLNTYFSEMVNIVADHNGIVNKFMGDAILAIFGLEPNTNPVQDAVDTAWAIQDHVESLRLSGRNTRLESGVGIHSGKAVAGTIGSPDRYEYTFIGDVVNTASRLDGLTKRLGCKIIVSADAYRQLSPSAQARFLDLQMHRLRGKAEPVHVYGTGCRDADAVEEAS